MHLSNVMSGSNSWVGQLQGLHNLARPRRKNSHERQARACGNLEIYVADKRVDQGFTSQPMEGKDEPQTVSDSHADATSTEDKMLKSAVWHSLSSPPAASREPFREAPGAMPLQDMLLTAPGQVFVALYQVDFSSADSGDTSTDSEGGLHRIRVDSADPLTLLKERSHMTTLLGNLKNFAARNPDFTKWMSDLYLLRFRNVFFLLLKGKAVTVTGWSSILQRFLELSVNQSTKQGNKLTLTDLTYSNHPNSRRLHSLGGGMRRVAAVVKGGKAHFTSKQVYTDLEYSVVLGNEDKLINMLFAIQNNTKFTQQEEKRVEEVQQLAQRLQRVQDDFAMYRLRASSLAEAKDAELKRLRVINAQLRQDRASLQSPHLAAETSENARAEEVDAVHNAFTRQEPSTSHSAEHPDVEGEEEARLHPSWRRFDTNEGSERYYAHKGEEANQVRQQARQAEAGVEDLEWDLLQPQGYLDEFRDRDRPDAKVARPDSAAPQGSNVVSQADKIDSQGVAAEKPRRGRGRPRKAPIMNSNVTTAQKRGRGRPRKQ